MVFDFVALDVETTGLDAKNDRIIEVGAVKFSGGAPVAEFATFINPRQELNPYITQLTGINGDDLADAPLFKDIAGTLVDFIGELPLCGHQIDFDINFLNEEFKRAGLPKLTVPDLDTALLSRMVVPEVMRFNLKHVTKSLELSCTRPTGLLPTQRRRAFWLANSSRGSTPFLLPPAVLWHVSLLLR